MTVTAVVATVSGTGPLAGPLMETGPFGQQVPTAEVITRFWFVPVGALTEMLLKPLSYVPATPPSLGVELARSPLQPVEDLSWQWMPVIRSGVTPPTVTPNARTLDLVSQVIVQGTPESVQPVHLMSRLPLVLSAGEATDTGAENAVVVEVLPHVPFMRHNLKAVVVVAVLMNMTLVVPDVVAVLAPEGLTVTIVAPACAAPTATSRPSIAPTKQNLRNVITTTTS